MPKLSRLAGSTGHVLMIFVQDSTKTTGEGLPGLVFNSAGLTCYYKRNSGTASVAVTLATITTLGTFTSGGFKEVDATNMKGLYEFHPPDAAYAAGAKSVVIMLQGAGNMAPVLIEIELTAVNNQDGQGYGLTALPVTGTLAVTPTLAATQAFNNTGQTTALPSAPTAGSITAATFGAGAIDANAFAQAAADKAWATAARTLTAFGFTVTVGTNNDKTGYALTTGERSSIAAAVLTDTTDVLGADIVAVKAKTDLLTFTGSNVNANAQVLPSPAPTGYGGTGGGAGTDVNVVSWAGTDVVTPNVPGIPVVDIVRVGGITVADGHAQGGGASTITLAAGDAAGTNAYVDRPITLTGGTGMGQSRLIIAYNAATKIATVHRPWDTVPDTTTTYELDQTAAVNLVLVGGLPVADGTAQAGSASTITLAANDAAGTNAYVDRTITLTGGTGYGQSRLITAYSSVTKQATVHRPWDTVPDNTTTYELDQTAASNMVEVSGLPAAVFDGKAQGGTTNTITLAGSDLAGPNAYVDRVITITGGTGFGQSRVITAYNSTSKIATVQRSWDTIPDTTSLYEIDQASASSVNETTIATQVNTTLSAAHGAGVWGGGLTTGDVQTALTTQGYTSARANNLDRLDVAVSSRSTYAGTPVQVSGYAAGQDPATSVWGATTRTLTVAADSPGTTTLLGRIPGVVQPQSGDAYAAATAITSNTARIVRVAPDQMVRPASGATAYEIDLYLYNLSGVNEDADTLPTVHARDATGASLDAGLASTTTIRLGVGHYRATYSVASTDALAEVFFDFAATVGGVTRTASAVTTVVAVASSTFTTADRTTLNAIQSTLGSPAGASMSADIAAVKTDTGAIRTTVTANLDVAVSTRSTYAGGAVASVTAPVTVGGYSSGQEPAVSVWGAATRTLTAFGFTVATDTAAIATAVDSQLSTTHGSGAWGGTGGGGSGLTITDVQSALTNQGYTIARATNLDRLDVAVSSRSTYAGADTTGTTTLLSLLTNTRAANLDRLDANVSGIPAAVWGSATRTLTAFAFTVAVDNNAIATAVDSLLTTNHGTGAWGGGTSGAGITIADVQTALTNQGFTTARATKLDNLDVAVSTRSTYAGGAVASVTAPVTVGGYSLNQDPATQVWGAPTRTLTAFGFTVAVNNTAIATAVDTQLTTSHGAGSWQPGTGITIADVQTALTQQGITTLRASRLDALDAPVSGVPGSVWGATTRTLTAFGFTVAVAGNVTVGAYATGMDPATQVLAIPGQKLATDGTGRVTAGTIADKAGYALSAAGLDAIVVETGINARQALAPILASAAGVSFGAGTGTIGFKGGNSATTRITATIDGSNNRTAITLTLPP
jgi:hypothetical protein